MLSIPGILMLLAYVMVVIYVIRGGSPMVSFIALAIVWALLGGLSFDNILKDILQAPVEKYASTILVIVFGSWFGQILVKTGIAGSLMKRSVELGGDRPIVVVIIIMLVTSFLFTSIYGVGAAIAVGVIAIPIMLSMGIPPQIAAPAFTMPIAAAMYINVIDINLLFSLFPKGSVSYDATYLRFAFVAFAVWILFAILMVVFNLKRYGLRRAWAVRVTEEVTAIDVTPWSYIAPVLPVLAIIVLKWPIVPSFLAGIAYALITTKGGHSKSWIDLFHRTFYDGVADLGGIIGVWVTVMMFMAASSKVAPTLNSIFSTILPHSTLTIAIFFAVLAPIAIYRGPMAAIGGGAALLSILLNANVAAPMFIFLMFRNINCLANCVDPTNSWTLWTVGYTKITPMELFKTALPFVWMAVAANSLLAYFMLGRG